MFDLRSGAAVRVRVQTRRDVCGARHNAAAAIGRAELYAPSLPPAAILCVRWMRVAEPIGAPHDLVSRRRFERALSLTLDDLARGAGRPADGPIGVCDAVLFDDLAELLACLARDWIDGLAADRWWWRALLRARVTLDLVVNTWTDAGSHIAPAFERLTAAGGAAAFASALEARHARTLAAAVSRAHGGPLAVELLGRQTPVERIATVPGRTGARPMPAIADAVTSLAARYGAASSSTALRYDQRALVALAAVARHRPPLLQQPRFVDAFHAAVRAAERGAETPLPVASAIRADPRPDERYGARDATARNDGDRLKASAPTSPSRPEVTWESPRRHEDAPLKGDRDLAGDRGEEIARRSEIDATASAVSQVWQASPATRASRAASPSITPFTDTPLGGVFYLLNVAIALRLYGDFTMPQRRGLPLSPGDFLALVAEQWLGEPLDASTGSLLARLAGRASHERPGEPLFTRDRLARWVPRMVRRINARVARGLGESADADVARRVLCHHARVYVTAAHVDVMFDLESLPIDIRLAGLDRDPGWMPPAGRIVTFHYV